MLVFDGGFGSEAVRKKYVLNDDPLWSARLLVDNHDAILDIHNSFLSAGADAITACTYQASVDGFVKYLNCSVEDAHSYIRNGAKLCKQACETYTIMLRNDAQKLHNEDQRILSCASLGPYGVFLSDGSEYNGHYVDAISNEEIKRWHNDQLSVLATENLDLYMFETIPALAEVVAVLPLLREYPNLKFTVTFSCKDCSSLNHGEDIREAIKLVNKYESVVAVGINCTSPLYITPLLEKISSLTTKDILIMPNSGETWSSKSWHSDTVVKKLSSYLPEWIERGATWIGSCCRTTPQDTKIIREAVDNFKKEKQ